MTKFKTPQENFWASSFGDEIKERVKACIKKIYVQEQHQHYSYCSFPEEECTCRDISELTEVTSLLTNGYIDSINLFVLINELEQEFNIKFEDDYLTSENFETVLQISELIKLIMN